MAPRVAQRGSFRPNPPFENCGRYLSAISGKILGHENSGDVHCSDPHAQAAFWAQVLGSVVEDHSALVDQLVADGRMPAEDRMMVGDHSAFREVAACSDPASVEPRLFFQRVPEQKIAKNRVHLDINVDTDRKKAEVKRLAGEFSLHQTAGLRALSSRLKHP